MSADASGAPSPWAVAGLGVQFAIALVAFVTVGNWMDGRLHTAPLFLLAGVFVGGGGTFYASYRRVMKASLARRDAPPSIGETPRP